MNRLLLIAINTIRGFASPAFNFLIAIFGIKFFGKEDWATLINALLWTFFIVLIISWGHKDYLIRKYSAQPAKMYHAFYSNVLTRSVLLPLSLLLLLFFPSSIAIWCIILVVLMHSYSAFDSLIVYHQKFSAQFIAETIAFGIIFCSLFYTMSFNIETFLKLYCIAFLCKFLYLIIALQLWKEDFSFQISLNEFKAGFGFFILGFSGWLISKIDIYIVAFYLPKAKLSEYQLLITAFLMLQATSSFIIVPFSKHLYRLSDDVLARIKQKLYIASVPLVGFGSFVIWIVMEQFVKLNLHYSSYVLGAFIALPSFFYSLNIMRLIRKHQEVKVIKMNFIGFAISLILILILIEDYQVSGVLISICMTQWVILILYKLNNK